MKPKRIRKQGRRQGFTVSFTARKLLSEQVFKVPIPTLWGRNGGPEGKSDLLRPPLLLSGEAGTVTQVTLVPHHAATLLSHGSVLPTDYFPGIHWDSL